MIVELIHKGVTIRKAKSLALVQECMKEFGDGIVLVFRCHMKLCMQFGADINSPTLVYPFTSDKELKRFIERCLDRFPQAMHIDEFRRRGGVIGERIDIETRQAWIRGS